jgi:hypothetical protein
MVEPNTVSQMEVQSTDSFSSEYSMKQEGKTAYLQHQ